MLEYTLGELVDRLGITNLKIWHIEEQLSDQKLDMAVKGKLCEDIVSLNKFRNECISSINEYCERMKH